MPQSRVQKIAMREIFSFKKLGNKKIEICSDPPTLFVKHIKIKNISIFKAHIIAIFMHRKLIPRKLVKTFILSTCVFPPKTVHNFFTQRYRDSKNTYDMFG